MWLVRVTLRNIPKSLNESPSKKEGKSAVRQGRLGQCFARLNESPSKKEGKLQTTPPADTSGCCLNESPSKKEGKCRQGTEASKKSKQPQ